LLEQLPFPVVAAAVAWLLSAKVAPNVEEEEGVLGIEGECDAASLAWD